MNTTKKKNNPRWAEVSAVLLLTFSLPRPAAAQAGTFSPTGGMGDARTVATATLLPNGTVLLAGGYNPPTTWASAEVYDPNTGLFTSTGAMTTARRAHTATLLANGKVLITGGRVPPNYFASAELYDPDTGLFSSTGSMNSARAFHSATLLANGKVLVAGGWLGGSNFVSSAELYDPDTGLFSPTGSLMAAREFHTATLLANGTVLIAGGDIGNTSLASAEIYDANVGLFYPTGSMGAARTSHTATLLPASAVRPHGKVLVAGGGSNSGPPAFASAELYDPDTGLFSPTGSMSTARWNHTATLLPAYEMRPHGRVLLAGGDGGSFSSGLLANAELYDPDTGTFSPTGSMSTLRHQHSATLLPNGKLLVAGGDNFPNALASAELYAPPQ